MIYRAADNMQAETAPPGASTLLLVLVALTFALLPRLLVATLSVVHWDESIYALVARDVKDGIMPFLGVFDHKPVALYDIYGAAQALFGETIIALRLLAVIVAAAGAFVLGRYCCFATGQECSFGLFAAAIYGLLSGMNGGLVAQPELMMNIAVALIWLIQLRLRDDRPQPVLLLAIGGVMGVAFNCNYLFGFLILAFCVDYLLFLADRHSVGWVSRHYLIGGLIIVAGFALTTALLLTPIWLAGALPDYLSMQVKFLSGYAERRDRLATLSDALTELRPYALLTSLFVAALVTQIFSRDGSGRNRHIRRALIYFAFGLIAAFASNRGHGKYFLLLLPAGIVLLCCMLQQHRQRLAWPLALWLIIFAVIQLETEREVIKQGLAGWMRVIRGSPSDLPARIALEIRPELALGETIYVYEYQPILYYLTDTVPPTKFANSIHHLHENYVAALGLDREETMNGIMEARPRFVIAGSDPAEGRYGPSSAVLAARLAQDYELVEILSDPFFHVLYGRAERDNPVRVYRLRDTD